MTTDQLHLWPPPLATVPRQWELYRWTTTTPVGTPQLGTTAFAAIILQQVQSAAACYLDKHGNTPDTVTIQTPPRILGPANARVPDGTFGTLGPYRVVMDPGLLFNEFGLSLRSSGPGPNHPE